MRFSLANTQEGEDAAMLRLGFEESLRLVLVLVLAAKAKLLLLCQIVQREAETQCHDFMVSRS